MKTIRPAAVAGSFYPADPDSLARLITSQLEKVKLLSPPPHPKAFIAPHAGYIYSGEIAASAYKQILPIKNQIKRVILIGPSHHIAFNGLAISSADYFSTPLGNIPLDSDAHTLLATHHNVTVSNQAHQAEHSLEVQLPFLQTVLDEFTIVPIITGDATPQQVATIIDLLWGSTETLLVISSDLSHYHDYHTARQLDKKTTQAILNLDIQAIDPELACGCTGIRGLLYFASQHPMTIKALDIRNSGDTAGDRNSVVGYGAFLFEEANDAI
jgi:AmmeMemoRadiSam system protein B